MKRVVYGLYEAWLTPDFMVERGGEYNPQDPHTAVAMSRFPDAFSDINPDDEDFEPVRRGPGRPRNDGTPTGSPRG